jgi:hypothetical protein
MIRIGTPIAALTAAMKGQGGSFALAICKP